jgi:hydroxyacylglutathione hydrolase
MSITLHTASVGPWPMNTYVVIDAATQTAAVIDPGADAETILALAGGAHVACILLTHAHPDHVGALTEVKAPTGAPVYLHPAEADVFGVAYDRPLADGDVIALGESSLRCIHTPGHTPGMICFDLGDGRIVVGDTFFVGGPGRTWSAADFATTLRTMQEIVFRWPDETQFFPGHGASGRIGDERPAFAAFVERGWPADLQGDVSWG